MVALALMKEDVVIHRWRLQAGTLTLGRHDANDIVIDDEAVSAHHAQLVIEKDPYFEGQLNIAIRDLNSTNGIYVNGQRVTRALLGPESTIKIAYNSFRILDPERNVPDRTAHIQVA